MTRTKLFFASAITAAAALSALSMTAATPAAASNCAMNLYDHNGSIMEVTLCDYTIHVSYDAPRPTMIRNSVTLGALLIDAKTWGNGHVKGNARVFKHGCGELSYMVEGRINGDRIDLYGLAPVRDSDCSIIRFRKDHLVFEQM